MRARISAIRAWYANSLPFKCVFDLVIDFGTSQSPKSTRPLTAYWCPSRPGHQALRNNFASSLLLRTWLPYDWTPRSEAYFVFPLAQGTPGKQCGLAAAGNYQPPLRSPWLAALDALTTTRFIDKFSFVEKFTQLHVSAFRCEGRPLPTCSPTHQDRIS